MSLISIENLLEISKEETHRTSSYDAFNRYFRRDYHFAKECFEAGEVCPRRVPGSENVADLLTKCLAPQPLQHLVPRFTGYAPLDPIPEAPPQ